MERTCFIHLTNSDGETVIIPEFMDAINFEIAMPPNVHNIVGKGVRYHPSHKPPRVVRLSGSILHKWLIERYIEDGLTPIEYIQWLENWRKAALPGHITIESDNPNYDTDMEVLIDTESWSVEHGQEDNIPYTITFYEYIDENVEILEPPAVGEEPTPPLLPRPDTSPPTPRTYTVVRGDSLWAITQRMTGDGTRWRELYELNQSVIWERADPSRGGNLIFPGQMFQIPESW